MSYMIKIEFVFKLLVCIDSREKFHDKFCLQTNMQAHLCKFSKIFSESLKRGGLQVPSK